MNKNLKSVFKKLHSPIIFVILGLILYTSASFFHMKKQLLKDIDHHLLTAAENMKYYTGENYVTKDMDEKTYSKDQIIEKAVFLDSVAKKIGVDYLYLLVKKEDDIRYAIMSDILEELEAHPTAYYWTSMKEDAEDDSYDLTRESFYKNKPVFLDSSDVWDSYRSVYLPQVSADGTFYLAGADITTSHLRDEIISKTFFDLFTSMVFLLLVLPLILAFMNLKKENTVTKDKIVDLKQMDHMTKAYNKNAGMHILKDIIEKRNDDSLPLAICLVDIQNLDQINKKMGLISGDNIIKIVGNILYSNFRKTDSIIRFEGGKFIVILAGCKSDCRAMLIKALQDKLSVFNISNKKNYYLKLHILFREYNGEETNEFIENSITHLNLHKKKQNTSDAVLQEEILEGLKNGEFKTFFQPKVFSREKTIEFEALVRWAHPKKGMIPPDKFIPIAEKSFVIHNITEKVLKDSIEFSQKINSKISVNISPVVFQNPNFSKEMEKVFKTREMAELILLEITEGVALNNFQVAVNKMNTLKKIGVEFSIDDFGIGYSSLSYLEKFPIAELKIDKSFVRNIHTNRINPLIINFVVKLGKIAGFKVIAEGVETEDHIKTLMSLGCHNFQGYYFDKPQPADIIYDKHCSSAYLNMIDDLKRK